MANSPFTRFIAPLLIVAGTVGLVVLGMLMPARPGDSPEDAGPKAAGQTEGDRANRALDDPAMGSPAATVVERSPASASAGRALRDAASAGDLAAVRAALEAGAVIDEPAPATPPEEARAGLTPLMLAARDSGFDCVKLLIDRGASVEYSTSEGVTALMMAAGAGANGALEALLSAGANIEARSNSGETALGFAAARGQSENLERLVEAGADPDAANAFGVTPLMMAAEAGALDRVLVLLDAGADPEMTDGNGGTAADRASSRSDDSGREIAQLLRSAMAR